MQVYDLDCSFILDLGLTCKSTDLPKTLLNIRSLSKHAIDTSSDACFLTDILSFKKHILPGENVLDIENTLNQVNILSNNSIDKYQSISFCYRYWFSCSIESCERIECFSCCV